MRAAFFHFDHALLRPRPPWCAWLAAARSAPDLAAPTAWQKRLRRHAHSLVEFHRHRDHFTVLLTTGPAGSGEAAADLLGIDALLAAPQPGAGPNWEAAAIRHFCQRYGFSQPCSYGYGGVKSDRLWLEVLGYPALVNPPLALRALARERSWFIVDLASRYGRFPPLQPPPSSAAPCVRV